MKVGREDNGNAQILIQTIIAGHCTNTGNKCTGKAGNKLGKKAKAIRHGFHGMLGSVQSSVSCLTSTSLWIFGFI